MIGPVRPSGTPDPIVWDRETASRVWREVSYTTASAGRLAWARALPTWRRWALVVALQGAVAVVSLGVQGPRADVSSVALVLALVALGALALVRVPLRSVGASPLRRPVLVGGLVLVPLLLVAPPVWPGVDMGAWSAVPVHVRCLVASTLTAGAAWLPYALLDRHGLGRTWATWGAAGAAGTLAFAVQMAHCPLVSWEHRLGAHATAGLWVGLTVAAWLALSRRGRRER